MIERHKKLIIGLSIYTVALYIIPLPFIFIFDRTDILGIASIIGCFLVLLFINFRASRNLTFRFKDEYLSKKKKVEKTQEFKEAQKLLWIYFLILVVLTIILCFVVI